MAENLPKEKILGLLDDHFAGFAAEGTDGEGFSDYLHRSGRLDAAA